MTPILLIFSHLADCVLVGVIGSAYTPGLYQCNLFLSCMINIMFVALCGHASI